MKKLIIESKYNSEKIAEQLEVLLASTEHFYLIYKHYHWNIVVKDFYSLHLLFDKHAGEIHEMLDSTAERMRQMGCTVPGNIMVSVEQSILNPALQENDDRQKILGHLIEQHNKFITLLEEIIELAGSEKDYTTADLLTKYLQIQQQQRWFIMASIKHKD
jgi:starvation-inducible DNA-binding protein